MTKKLANPVDMKKNQAKIRHTVWETSEQRSCVKIKRKQKLYFKKECQATNPAYSIFHFSGKRSLKVRGILSEGEHWEWNAFFFLIWGLRTDIFQIVSEICCFDPAFSWKNLSSDTKIKLYFNSQTKKIIISQIKHTGQ